MDSSSPDDPEVIREAKTTTQKHKQKGRTAVRPSKFR